MSLDNERVIIEKYECMEYVDFLKAKYEVTNDETILSYIRTLNYCANILFANKSYVMLPCSVMVRILALKSPDTNYTETYMKHYSLLREKVVMFRNYLTQRAEDVALKISPKRQKNAKVLGG